MDAERLNAGREKERVIVSDRHNPNDPVDVEAALLARVYSLILSWGDETTMDSVSEDGDVVEKQTTPAENPAPVKLRQIPAPQDIDEQVS